MTFDELFKAFMNKEADLSQAEGEYMRARRELILQTMAFKEYGGDFNHRKLESLIADYKNKALVARNLREEFDNLHEQVVAMPYGAKINRRGRSILSTWSV